MLRNAIHVRMEKNQGKKYLPDTKLNYSIDITSFQAETDCVKCVQIHSYSGLHFPVFRLNTVIYGQYFRIAKIWENAKKFLTWTFFA